MGASSQKEGVEPTGGAARAGEPARPALNERRGLRAAVLASQPAFVSCRSMDRSSSRGSPTTRASASALRRARPA